MEEEKKNAIPGGRPGDGEKPEMMRLVGELSRMFRGEMRRVCGEDGLPVGYRGVLFHLAQEEGQTQKALAEKTGVRAASMSVTIDKMERDGYIFRKRDEKDLRTMRVYLTDKGRELDRRNKERIGRLEKQFSSVISPSERETLTALLQKVISALSGSLDCPSKCESAPRTESERSGKQ